MDTQIFVIKLTVKEKIEAQKGGDLLSTINYLSN